MIRPYNFLFFFTSLLIVINFSNPKTSFNQTELNPRKDSINLWVEQSKDLSLTLKEKEAYLTKAYQQTEEIKNDSVKLNHLVRIVHSANLSINSNLFVKFNKKANTLAVKLKDTLKIASSHYSYGARYYKLNKLDSSYYHFNKARKYNEYLKNTKNLADIIYYMAMIQWDVKNYTGSEILIFQALKKYKKVKENVGIRISYNLLALTYGKLQEYDKSLAYHSKALEIIKFLKNKKDYENTSLNNIANVYRNKGEFNTAIDYYTKILKTTKFKKEDPDHYARVLDNLTYAKFLKGDTLHAIKNYKTALAIRDSMGNISGIVTSKLNLANYYAYALDTVKATKHAKDVSILATKIDDNSGYLKSLKLLSTLDKKNSNLYLNTYLNVNDSLQIEERKIRNKFTRIRFETDEYIEETEKLSQQRIIIFTIGLTLSLLFASLYYIKRQRSKNKELLFESEQQKANEEIYALMLRKQSLLQEGRIKERNRMAEDLHDGIIGRIFGTRLLFGSLELKGPEEDETKFDDLITELQEIEKEVRSISHELSASTSAANQNFISIVSSLVEKYAEIGDFNHKIISNKTTNWLKIQEVIKINIYRIIQEALQNCCKYAYASNVTITFKDASNDLEVIIKDDGKGFDLTTNKKGIGLKNIKSRVSKLNGNCNFESEKDKGTIITIKIPKKFN